MNFTTKEYVRTIEVSRDDVYKMKRALFFLDAEAFTDEDFSKFSNSLNSLSLGSTLLSLLFGASTVLGVVGTVTTILGGLTSDLGYKNTLQGCIQDGHKCLEYLLYWFDDHPEVDKVRTKATYLELNLPNDRFRFIEHTKVDYIDGALIDGQWIYIN